ncbi:MAG TPA: trypsin-like peptidase domain-containing protein [Vicinamibacterales bacterium]|nr:trypsin-like peptidase domain-containing protein [Vicinamibacterales bacterium]
MSIKTVFGALVLACFIAGLVVSARLAPTSPSVAVPQPEGDQARPAALPGSIPGNLPDLSTVAERALKVSANISSTTVMAPPNDPIYRFLYGRQEQKSQSVGSGVVVSADGYVLTNTHVIGYAGADIRVTLPGGREMQGKLVGIDDVSDLAVVKVDAQNLETLPWGDSGKLRVAEWVLAIGNPFQLSGTVTLGIVSTVNRSATQVGGYTDFIQTDAAINPGNSGGALVNSRGELIGINTMIYSETGGYQGIGFAIPSNMARRIMDELKTNGTVPWGSIGRVVWVPVDRTTAQRNGFGDVSGAYVRSLQRGSSAHRAGLLPGDLVIGVNGQEVKDPDQIDRVVVESKVGTRLKLDVLREGRRLTLDIPIVSRQQGQPR